MLKVINVKYIRFRSHKTIFWIDTKLLFIWKLQQEGHDSITFIWMLKGTLYPKNNLT